MCTAYVPLPDQTDKYIADSLPEVSGKSRSPTNRKLNRRFKTASLQLTLNAIRNTETASGAKGTFRKATSEPPRNRYSSIYLGVTASKTGCQWVAFRSQRVQPVWGDSGGWLAKIEWQQRCNKYLCNCEGTQLATKSLKKLLF